MRLDGKITGLWGDEHVQKSSVVNITHVEAVAKGKIVMDLSRLIVLLVITIIAGFDIGAMFAGWTLR